MILGMTNPQIPLEYKKKFTTVTIGKYACIGVNVLYAWGL
jgi:hypothetical protein